MHQSAIYCQTCTKQSPLKAHHRAVQYQLNPCKESSSLELQDCGAKCGKVHKWGGQSPQLNPKPQSNLLLCGAHVVFFVMMTMGVSSD